MGKEVNTMGLGILDEGCGEYAAILDVDMVDLGWGLWKR
jgi:hypothetical protein